MLRFAILKELKKKNQVAIELEMNEEEILRSLKSNFLLSLPAQLDVSVAYSKLGFIRKREGVLDIDSIEGILLDALDGAFKTTIDRLKKETIRVL